MFLYVFTGGVLSTIAFSLYVTFHPGMKGIVFRPDDTGVIRFTPSNLGRFILAPFHDSTFWKVSLLDTNYLVWLICGMGGGGLVYNGSALRRFIPLATLRY